MVLPGYQEISQGPHPCVSLILPICFLSDFLKFRYKLLVTFFQKKKKISIPGLDFKCEKGRTGFGSSCSSESPTTGCGCWAGVFCSHSSSASAAHTFFLALILPWSPVPLFCHGVSWSIPLWNPRGPRRALGTCSALHGGTEQGQALSLLILNS